MKDKKHQNKNEIRLEYIPFSKKVIFRDSSYFSGWAMKPKIRYEEAAGVNMKR